VLRRHGHALVPHWIQQPLRSELARSNSDVCVALQQRRRFSSPARHEEANLLQPPEALRHPAPSSIEVWQPFADRRLHEFLLAIPPEQKFEPHPATDEFYAGSKWLIRRALRGILPESVRTRQAKTDFVSWVNAGISQQWSTYERLFGSSARTHVAARGYVDQDEFASALGELREGNDRPDLLWIMQIVGLETWLRAVALPRAEFVRPPPANPRLQSSSPTSGH
jgi:asparagine synthase (glutamine-hydrolysing)